MKNLSIYSFKALILCFFFTLSNCEKDNFEFNITAPENHTLPYTLKKLSKPEFDRNKELTSKLDCFKSKSQNQFSDNKTVYNSEFDFYVETNNLSYLESLDGSFHTYTFAISNEEDTNIKYNLIFSLEPDGSYSTKIAQYTFNNKNSFILRFINIELDDTNYLNKGELSFSEVCETAVTYECNTWLNGNCASLITVAQTTCYYTLDYGFSTG